jgi:hypothetical protein
MWMYIPLFPTLVGLVSEFRISARNPIFSIFKRILKTTQSMVTVTKSKMTKLRNSWIINLFFIGCCHATCFQNREELSLAVTEYLKDNSVDTVVAKMYGHPIGSWCVTDITDFSKIFLNATDFNEDISDWDTSNAKTMHGMFEFATSFNQPLETWDTSGVENMKAMFYGARSFNQPLASWDISGVRNMKEMFHRALNFNQDLCSWGDQIRFVLLEQTTKDVVPGEELFAGTSCPLTNDPDWTRPIQGPFCYQCRYGRPDDYATFVTWMCIKMLSFFVFGMALLVMLTMKPWENKKSGIDPSDSKLTEFELLHLAGQG